MAPPSKTSKRSSLRFKFASTNITYMAKGQLGRATLQNISTGGCALTNCTTTLAKNDQVLVVIEFAEREKPLELKARVIRAGDTEFSAVFTDLDDSFKSRFSILLADETRLARKTDPQN